MFAKLARGIKWILSETGTSALGHIVAETTLKPAAVAGGTAIVRVHIDRREYEASRARPVESALGLHLLEQEPALAHCLYDEESGGFSSSDRQRMWACHTFEAIFFDSKEGLALSGEKEQKPTKEPGTSGVVQPIAERMKATAYAKAMDSEFSGRPIRELVTNKDFISKRFGPHLAQWREHTKNTKTFDRALKAVSEDPTRGLVEKGKTALKALDRLPGKLEKIGIMTNERRGEVERLRRKETPKTSKLHRVWRFIYTLGGNQW